MIAGELREKFAGREIKSGKRIDKNFEVILFANLNLDSFFLLSEEYKIFKADTTVHHVCVQTLISACF